MHNMREGFWKDGPESLLPMPIVRKKPWKGKKHFLQMLDNMEERATAIHAKGSSKCRCCGARNGSNTYKFGGWPWPEGFRHYIDEHNVRPSLAFQEFVLEDELQ